MSGKNPMAQGINPLNAADFSHSRQLEINTEMTSHHQK